jgi:membrane protease YdiL (CAAX protease family)
MKALEQHRSLWDRAIGDVHWEPNQETWVALASYLLVVGGLSVAFQVFTTARVAANFITYGPITLALLGVGVPVFYMTMVRHRSLADLGITWRQLIPSLILGLLLGWDTWRETLRTLGWQPTREAVPLMVMALAVGIFEAIFFRGWLQLRFEEAFGIVPGLILASLCYSLYHVGYGMTGREMLFLFGLGMTFAAVFRLTKNVFVLWPFYTPVGSLYTNTTEGLTMPFEATYGFLLTLGLMAILICSAAIGQRRRGIEGKEPS